MHVVESDYFEIMEICDEIEEEEHLEVFGPQIELNLENPFDMGEPAVEAAGVAPTAVVEVEEESSMEVLEASASVKKVGDQAVRTVDETVHDFVEEGTGVEPILMEVDEVRTGGETVLASVEMEMGEQGVQIGDEPVHEALKERTGAKLVLSGS